MKHYIYNLQFTPHRDEMSILGYTFRRVESYEDKAKRLSHHVHCIEEFDFQYSTGEHVVTATVESPLNEPQSPLAHGEPMPILEDVLLILSLFTGREVFSSMDENPIGIKRDARPYLGYDTLGISIPFRSIEYDQDHANVGFEEGLERVLKLIHTREWLEKFDRGIILFIARQVFIFQVLEKAFLMSYILWEHVFYIEKRTTMSDKTISDTDGAEKVRFVLQTYGFTSKLNEGHKARIRESLTKTRNDLVHYGAFKRNEKANAYRDAIQFVELTTRLLAKILGLEPSDGKNTQRWLEEVLGCKVTSTPKKINAA